MPKRSIANHTRALFWGQNHLSRNADSFHHLRAVAKDDFRNKCWGH